MYYSLVDTTVHNGATSGEGASHNRGRALTCNCTLRFSVAVMRDHE